MSTFLHTPSRLIRRTFFVLMMTMASAVAGDDDKATETAARLMPQQEKEGYEFRAQAWVNDLEPKLGRAVRLQLFKGNEYAFCIAVPQDSGVHVTAAVLDFDGNLYDTHVRVRFVGRVRGEAKFESIEALIEQIALDCDHARSILAAA